MKFSINNLFDRSKLEEELRNKLSELIDYVNNISQQVQRTLSNGLDFSTNFNCTIKEVELTSGSYALITIPKFVIGSFVIESNCAYKDFKFVRTNSGTQIFATATDGTTKVVLKIIFLH